MALRTKCLLFKPASSLGMPCSQEKWWTVLSSITCINVSWAKEIRFLVNQIFTIFIKVLNQDEEVSPLASSRNCHILYNYLPVSGEGPISDL